MDSLLLRIPVTDRRRAAAFYAALFGNDGVQRVQLELMEQVASAAALLRVSIASVEDALAIVWSHGGRVLDPDCWIDERPSCALVVDTEGNRLALMPTDARSLRRRGVTQKISFTPIEGSSGKVSSSSSS